MNNQWDELNKRLAEVLKELNEYAEQHGIYDERVVSTIKGSIRFKYYYKKPVKIEKLEEN